MSSFDVVVSLEKWTKWLMIFVFGSFAHVREENEISVHMNLNIEHVFCSKNGEIKTYIRQSPVSTMFTK